MKYTIHIDGIPTEDVFWDKQKAIKFFYDSWISSGFKSKVELYRDLCGKKYSINDKRSILILTRSTVDYSFSEKKNILELINYL